MFTDSSPLYNINLMSQERIVSLEVQLHHFLIFGAQSEGGFSVLLKGTIYHVVRCIPILYNSKAFHLVKVPIGFIAAAPSL